MHLSSFKTKNCTKVRHTWKYGKNPFATSDFVLRTDFTYVFGSRYGSDIKISVYSQAEIKINKFKIYRLYQLTNYLGFDWDYLEVPGKGTS